MKSRKNKIGVPPRKYVTVDQEFLRRTQVERNLYYTCFAKACEHLQHEGIDQPYVELEITTDINEAPEDCRG